MRLALRNTAEVFHFWNNQSQHEGRAGNVFFRGPQVFSYGSHFCIARILPSGAVAFTTRKYSVSTAKHVSAARQAARNRAYVFCHDPSDEAGQNMRHARDSIGTMLARATAKGIRQTTRDALKAGALHAAESANAYLAALPEDERGHEQPIDTASLEHLRDSLIAAETAREALRLEQLAARQADAMQTLAEWRTGAVHTATRLYDLPVALRMSSDGSMVQTSHGADIPTDHARALWPLVLRVMADGRGWDGQGRALGAYRLSRIRADGSIVVGCHDIAFNELEGIAVTLGLIEVAGA